MGMVRSEVQTRVADVLRQNSHTRNASLRVDVRIWPDSTGRVTRAQLVSSTGNAEIDNAIKNEVLTGLQLQEPPPAGIAHADSPAAHRAEAELNRPHTL